MFSLSYMTPRDDFAGTIEFESWPTRLGIHRDIHGDDWDVIGIIGRRYVQACRRSSIHPYYTDTTGNNFGYVSQRWQPYQVSVPVSNKGN